MVMSWLQQQQQQQQACLRAVYQIPAQILEECQVQSCHQTVTHQSLNPVHVGRKSEVLPEHMHSEFVERWEQVRTVQANVLPVTVESSIVFTEQTVLIKHLAETDPEQTKNKQTSR